MAKRYGTFTAKRRAALRKAQLASAAKRRGKGKRKVSNRTKRVAKTVGIVGLTAASGYGAYKASGSKLIVSPRTPTVHHHVTGRPIGTTGFRKQGKVLTFVSRTSKGDKHILLTRTGNVFGKKISGHPKKVTQYKPERAFVNRSSFKKSNYAHTPEAKRALKRKYQHSVGHIRRTGVSEAEALRRTQSYVDARSVNGRKVSVSERNKALNRYRGQKR